MAKTRLRAFIYYQKTGGLKTSFKNCKQADIISEKKKKNYPNTLS